MSGDSGYVEADLAATNRRGRAITCTVACTPLTSSDGDGRGVILLMKDKADGLAPLAPPDGPLEVKKGDGAKKQASKDGE